MDLMSTNTSEANYPFSGFFQTAEKLQKDLKEATDKLERANGGKPPKLGALPKTPSVEVSTNIKCHENLQ